MESMENLRISGMRFLSVLKRFFFFLHGTILGFPHEKGHVSQKDGRHKFPFVQTPDAGPPWCEGIEEEFSHLKG